MKKGKHIIRNDAARRIRALKMIDYRISHGATHEQIAEHFNVSKDTVRRTLNWADKAGLLVRIEDELLQDIMPLAQEALATALADGEHPQQAGLLALELLKGLVPGFGTKHKNTGTLPSGNAPDDLARHVDQLRSELGVIEGTVAGAISAPEPPAEASNHPQGDGSAADSDGHHDILLALREASMGEPSDEGSPEGA